MDDLAAVIDSVAGLAALVTAVGILALQWSNGRKADEAKVAASAAKLVAEESKAVLIETAGEVREVGKAIDGRLTALLAAKDAEFAAEVKRARAEGRAEGEQAQRDRAAGPQL